MENTLTQNNWVRNTSISLVLALGSLGGTALVLSHMFFTRGKYLLLVYAGVVIATGAILKASKVSNYAARFQVGLGSFMLASLAHYVYVCIDSGAFSHLNIFGHAWRLGLVLLIGTAINLALARVSE
jgi:hypothetical protein